MKRLVKLQLRNIFHNKSFYVCLGLIILMSPITSFITDLVMSNKEGTKVLPSIMGFLSGEVGILSKIFIALFCCFDFSNETTKNIIAKGYTRVQLLFSKYIGSFVGVFLIYIITFLVTFVLFIKNGIGYDSNMVYVFINDIFMISALIIFFSTMSFIVEKSGGAIVACLFVPTVITFALVFIDSNFKLNISNFWIDNISDKFLKTPTFENLCISIFGYLAYIVLFVVLGIKLSQMKEIK